MDPREEIKTEPFLCPKGHSLELSRHPNGALEVVGTTTCAFRDEDLTTPEKVAFVESLRGFTFCCPECLMVYWIKDADSKPAMCTPLQLLTYMYVVAKNENNILMGYIKRNTAAAMQTADLMLKEICLRSRRGGVVS